MNSKLFEDHYLIVRNFISFEKANKLAEDFKNYANTYDLKGDSHVPSCRGKYDYLPFIELLCEKTNIVSELIGESILPTYSYARIYQHGNELTPHVDKHCCEISLTVNLDCDEPWSIWIQTPKKVKKEIVLNPGDAMIYFGIEALHWREPFKGEYCNQVFLHYVRSRGPYSSSYFDKDHRICEDIIRPKEFLSNLNDTMNESKLPVTKSLDTLASYIKVYDSILTKDQCDLIISEYNNSNEWRMSEIGVNGNQNTSVRNCDIINMSLGHVIDINQEVRKKIDDILFTTSAIAAKKYIVDFPNCFLQSDSGYDLLRYQKDGCYIQHTDNFKTQPRTVSMSFNLNDDYLGGEFAFFDREIKIRTRPGSVIVFPSNFMYPHEIMPIIKGTRYSVVTWFT